MQILIRNGKGGKDKFAILSKTNLDILREYTHRVTISNSRILKIENDNVSFNWRDYKDNSKCKVMTLSAFEFIQCNKETLKMENLNWKGLSTS
jgi:hypothetical protein